MKRLICGLSVLLSVFGVDQACAALPEGTVRIKSTGVFKSAGKTCGLVKKRWIPGSMYQSRVFYPYSAQQKNTVKAAAKTSGSAKSKLQRQALKFKNLAKKYARFCKEGPSRNLELVFNSAALGRVISNPSGIDCGANCSAAFSVNSKVVLTPAPESSLVEFTGWGGDCSGLGDCTLVMSAKKQVIAYFSARPVFKSLAVERLGTGSG